MVFLSISLQLFLFTLHYRCTSQLFDPLNCSSGGLVALELRRRKLTPPFSIVPHLEKVWSLQTGPPVAPFGRLSQVKLFRNGWFGSSSEPWCSTFGAISRRRIRSRKLGSSQRSFPGLFISNNHASYSSRFFCVAQWTEAPAPAAHSGRDRIVSFTQETVRFGTAAAARSQTPSLSVVAGTQAHGN